jgi:hypothetical protein
MCINIARVIQTLVCIPEKKSKSALFLIGEIGNMLVSTRYKYLIISAILCW